MPETSRPLRRSRPMWLVVVSFAALAGAVVGLSQYREHRRRQRMPKTLTQLAQRIKEKHPEWFIILAAPSSPEKLDAGFYVCTHKRSFDELVNKFFRVKEQGSRWRGVVSCLPLERTVAYDWDEYGYTTERNALFGDTKMMSEIIPITP